MEAEPRDACILEGLGPRLPVAVPVPATEHEAGRAGGPSAGQGSVRVGRKLNLTRLAVLRLSQQDDAAGSVHAIPRQAECLTAPYPGEHRELDQISERRIPALPARGE